MNDRRGPITVELDGLTEITSEPVATASTSQVSSAEQATRFLGRRWSRVFVWFVRAGIGLFLFALGIWAWDFTTGLLARSPVIGSIATGLAGVFLLLGLILVLRELAALNRLSALDSIRSKASDAREGNDIQRAREVVSEIARLYRNRDDTSWGERRVTSVSAEHLDAHALLDHFEREVMSPLDDRAMREVEAAAARVATLTALVPLALFDVATALVSNLRMIRRIADVYGGRSGTLGAWRLTRAVFAHLAATGAIAIGDDLLSSALGGGVVSKLSRRFGEGLINGALTARVGIAAIELCRPLEFQARPKPTVTSTIKRALSGIFSRETTSEN